MKRTIFIPTDFSDISLGLVEHALQQAGSDEIEIVLTHCMFLTDSITELLFFDKDDVINSLKSQNFKNAFRTLRRQYQHVKVMFRWEIFTGLNQSAFNRFVLGNNINEAVMPVQYFPLSNKTKSFDPTPYVHGSKIRVTEYPVHIGLLCGGAQKRAGAKQF